MDKKPCDKFIIITSINNLTKAVEAFNLSFMLECTELGTQRAGHTQQDVYDILNEFGLHCFYWDSEQQIWGKDKAVLLKAGNIWACRNKEQLPATRRL